MRVSANIFHPHTHRLSNNNVIVPSFAYCHAGVIHRRLIRPIPGHLDALVSSPRTSQQKLDRLYGHFACHSSLNTHTAFHLVKYLTS